MSVAPDIRIIDKLRKVLALTNSPVEGEAQAAAAHLQRLLTEYNLSVADLEARGNAKPGVRKDSHDLGKAAFKWKLTLADEIAEFYYCHPMVNYYTKTVAFVGRPDNVESLKMLYVWVIEQIKRIARDERRAHFDKTGEHIDPLRWQVAFGEGAVERLIDRLHVMRKEMEARAQEDADGETTALVVVSDERKREISDFLEEQGLRRIDGRETKREREWREKREAENARLAKLKETDLEAYYEECPWERPETPEEIEERNKRNAEYQKKEERNRRRRENYVPRGYGRERRVDWDKEDQTSTARESGRKSASKINLQPFIGDGKSKSKGELK